MLRIPEAAVANLLLQRTQYIQPLKQAQGNQGQLLGMMYFREMMQEFNQIRPALPAECRSVMDIGCGLGGIDVLIDRHYGGRPTFSMVDKDGSSPRIYHGFEAEGAFYNELSATREFLAMNGVDGSRVRTFDVNAGAFPEETGFDVVLSLLSWGFHYPVATYAEAVRSRLSPSGVLVLDVRLGTGGEEALSRLFGRIDVLQATPKYARLAVREPAAAPAH
jgi:SAM-dependent methyltransferase